MQEMLPEELTSSHVKQDGLWLANLDGQFPSKGILLRYSQFRNSKLLRLNGSWHPGDQRCTRCFHELGTRLKASSIQKCNATVCLNQKQFCSWMTVFLNYPIPGGNIFRTGYSCDTFLCKWSNFLFFSMKSLPFLPHRWIYLPMDLIKRNTCWVCFNWSQKGTNSALNTRQ